MKNKKPNLLTLFRLPQTVFTFREIAMLWGETDAVSLKRKINYHVKAGNLIGVRRGIYAKVDTFDPMEAINKIYTPSYISLETVLKNEGIIFQFDRTIFAVSYLSRTISVSGYTFTFRKVANHILYATAGVTVNQGKYSIATKERAYLDALYLYKDFHFDNLRAIDWSKCWELAPVYQTAALEKRLKQYQKENQHA